MNMKKTALLCAAAFAAACLLSACGKKGSDANVDIAKLSTDLKATVTSGELADISADMIASTYFVEADQIEEASASLSSGATACEVAIIKCKESGDVKSVQDKFKTRVENQTALYADYNQPEVEKLNEAIIDTNGNYVVLCVTDDVEAAKNVLKEAGF